MKTKYLLPNRYKKIGWCFFIPSFFLGLAALLIQFDLSFFDGKLFAIVNSTPLGKTKYMSLVETNIFDEILSLLMIISALIVSFSKTRNEDEYITKIRLESLVWAVYINYIILIFCIAFLYNFAFFYALVLNMFTVLLCFIVRFHWKIYSMPGGGSYEK